MTAFEIQLPSWPSPPLNLNHRHHWSTERKIARELREHAGWAAKAAKVGGPYEHVTVVLHWQPGRIGVYDNDNPVPTLKHLADGLVDAGVVVDDSFEQMTKRVRIHVPVPRQPRLWLEITPSTVGSAA